MLKHVNIRFINKTEQSLIKHIIDHKTIWSETEFNYNRTIFMKLLNVLK